MTDLERDNLVRAHNLEQLVTSPGWAEFAAAIQASMEMRQAAVMHIGVQTLCEQGQVLWLAENIVGWQTMRDILGLPEALIEELRPEPEAAEEATDAGVP